MSPRPRKPINRDLTAVPNLYRDRKGYYTYRDPVTGVRHGLGSDKMKALTQAADVNRHYAAVQVTLLDKITGAGARTVKDWCEQYGPHLRKHTLSADLGHHVLERLEPVQIAEWLKKWDAKPRMRQAMLSTAKVIFGAAIGAGWIKTNPAADLTTPAPVTMRERLSLAAFVDIHKHAEDPLKRAMELALMTCARRENVIALMRADIKDGYLHVEHIKGGLKVRYPLSLHLAAVGWTLGDVVGRCRSSVVSRYLIHHISGAGMAKPGDKYRDKTIEQMFRTARDDAKIYGAHPPTFHEIRSLSARLWQAQGVDAKAMAGHRTDKMAALYQDSRGSEWVTIAG